MNKWIRFPQIQTIKKFIEENQEIYELENQKK